ncbi:MAG: SDR family oxidoreductase [Alphaproteobacteria bacterium]|jgi:NAD(P)-dependent dehydrogenase (short-subunit alcohol dehydrogenase family)|nr:SDR family oxidoreductase [Alphaproteobacteria bacterium]MDP6254906.1 SDR family oxidoreductase [Alphaproteobacteria bacterium]MDP7053980.1 SDR family oxidoreductase [Alphaproteobacteria bacterium]MDP7227291.1 SDR family oxidoreductase [Alphaproteobacteria bacterium]MDP7461316.1 SDR family oxidoreductase [Alphaproteobacteria bacterium]|tara:strand:- start:559 stop:1455 length:897 start_codon:yes stop_codon:yes gene_type:complete
MAGSEEGRLAGKVAMITGGTSGMGAVTAQRFVAKGAQVVLTGRSEARGQALVEEIGANARFIRMEASDEEQIKGAVDFTISEFGHLDCLFNNAGAVTHSSRIEKITTEQFDYEMAALVGGVLFAMKHAIPIMREQGAGSIINNASTAGHRTGHGPILYSIAKAAVLHLTRVVAMQNASTSIRVNSISPACVATPAFSLGTAMTQEQSAASMPIIERELSKIVPLGRAGESEDVAAMLVFLASDESRYITAQDIAVDGGLIAGYTPIESLDKFGGLHAELTVELAKMKETSGSNPPDIG